MPASGIAGKTGGLFALKKLAQQLTADIMAPYIQRWEGTRTKPYRDSRGVWTTGTGINLQTPSARAWLKEFGTTPEDVIAKRRALTPEELQSMYQRSIGNAIQSAYKLHPNLSQHPLPVQGIVTDMVYNLGEGGYADFVKARKALDRNNYSEMARQLRASPWFKQTRQRAQHHVNTLRALGAGKPLPKVQPVVPALTPTDAPSPVSMVSGSPAVKTGAVQDKIVYHGSPKKLKALQPRTEHGDPDVSAAVFASPHRAMALAYLGKKWGDRDIEQAYRNGRWSLREMRPGAFDEVYPVGHVGFLYHLLASAFKRPKRSLGSNFEVISDKPVKPENVDKVPDIRRALLDAGVQLHAYQPDHQDYEAAVTRMTARLRRMEPPAQQDYLRWVRESNPGLADRIQEKAMQKTSAAGSTLARIFSGAGLGIAVGTAAGLGKLYNTYQGK